MTDNEYKPIFWDNMPEHLLGWMYSGPLKHYAFMNYDIDDLLSFLRPFKNNDSIWIIDNFMCPVYGEIPAKYTTVIIGFFGERIEFPWLDDFVRDNIDRKIIVLTSHNLLLEAHPHKIYLPQCKFFYIEHLHKAVNFLFEIDLKQNVSQKFNYIEWQNRKFTNGMLINRLNVERLLFLALLIKNCGLDSVFSLIDDREFNFDELTTFTNRNDLTTLDLNSAFLEKIIYGPRYSMESLIINDTIQNKVVEYYKNDNFKFNFDSLNNQIPVRSTYIANESIFNTFKLNWIIETEVYNVFGREMFLTEKTLKSLISKTPFVLISNNNSYSRIERLGFVSYRGPLNIPVDIYNGHIEQLLLIDNLMKTLNKDYLMDCEVEITKIANYNYEWFYGKFYDHCESLNKNTLVEIADYLNEN